MPAYKTFARRQRCQPKPATRQQAINAARRMWGAGSLLIVEVAGQWRVIPAQSPLAQQIRATGYWPGLTSSIPVDSLEEVACLS